MQSRDHDRGRVCIRAKKCCASPVRKYAYHASSVSDRKTSKCARICFAHGKAPAALDESELRGIAEFACRVAGRSTEKSGGISAITEMPDEVFMG